VRIYSDEEERIIRAKRLADQWMHSDLIDRSQHERMAARLTVDLRRTNLFLRLTLFGFGLLIIGAAVGLVGVVLDLRHSTPVGVLCLVAAGLSAIAAELLVGKFRVYRFGIEEAFAVSAAMLLALGSALLAELVFPGVPVRWELVVALIVGSVAAFAIYRRFGYVYAGVAAMLGLSLAAFPLELPMATQRAVAAALLGAGFLVARMKRRAFGDEFPGDEYGILQAAAWLGIYAALNLHLYSAAFVPQPRSFYWFTYAMIWILPVAGAWLSIRDRDRPLLDASLVLALATLATNKPYLGLERKPWDPILLGLLLIGAAIVLRRWLARGEDGPRHGFIATPVLRSDNETLARLGIASAAIHGLAAHPRVESPSPEPASPDPFQGGRSGGGGGASF
jgi:hypothetical protein